MDQKYLFGSTAIVSIAVIEAIALLKGLDGQIFLSTVGTIFGIVGYIIGKKKVKKDD